MAVYNQDAIKQDSKLFIRSRDKISDYECARFCTTESTFECESFTYDFGTFICQWSSVIGDVLGDTAVNDKYLIFSNETRSVWYVSKYLLDAFV